MIIFDIHIYINNKLKQLIKIMGSMIIDTFRLRFSHCIKIVFLSFICTLLLSIPFMNHLIVSWSWNIRWFWLGFRFLFFDFCSRNRNIKSNLFIPVRMFGLFWFCKVVKCYKASRVRIITSHIRVFWRFLFCVSLGFLSPILRFQSVLFYFSLAILNKEKNTLAPLYIPGPGVALLV